MYFEEKGAYTGEISPNMLTDAGVKYVIIGHSERREYFAETDETVNKKVLKAFEHGLTPIICCGETLTQREQGITLDWIRQQIKIAFQNVTAEQAKTAVIAYEPIWAIGTGKVATTEQAEEVCGAIRACIKRECTMRRPQRRSAFSTAVPYPQHTRSGAVCTAGYRWRSGRRRILKGRFWKDCKL